MIQAAEIFGTTGISTAGLIGAGVGIGVLFGTLYSSVPRSPSLRVELYFYAKLGFKTLVSQSYHYYYVSIVYLSIIESNISEFINSCPKYVRYIWYLNFIIIGIWMYVKFIGFNIIYCATDGANPFAMEQLRLAIRVLIARKTRLVYAIMSEDDRLRALMAQRPGQPISRTIFDHLVDEETQITMEVALLTRRLAELAEEN